MLFDPSNSHMELIHIKKKSKVTSKHHNRNIFYVVFNYPSTIVKWIIYEFMSSYLVFPLIDFFMPDLKCYLIGLIQVTKLLANLILILCILLFSKL